MFRHQWFVWCQWQRQTHFVLGPDLYEVFCVFQQILEFTGLGLGTQFLNLGICGFSCLSLLHNIVGDWASTIVFWWFPWHHSSCLGDLWEFQGSSGGWRCLCNFFYLWMVSNQQNMKVLQNMLTSKAIKYPHKNIPGGLIGVTSSDIKGSLLPTWLTALTLKWYLWSVIRSLTLTFVV